MKLMSVEKITEFDGESVELEFDGTDCFVICRATLRDNGLYLPDLSNYPFSCSKNFVSKTHLLRFINADVISAQNKIKEVM